MGTRTGSLRERGVRLAVAGVVAVGVAAGGVTVAGAAPAPAAPVAAPVAAPAPVAAAPVAPAAVPVLPSVRYDMYYNIKRTARYPKTVFSEVTNEGRFNQIFPIKGAKPNLGRVGTRHDLKVGPKGFPVTVELLGSTTWRFKTRPGHPDHKGTVQFWLYKSGTMLKLHVRGICLLCGNPGYKAVAYAQWLRFAVNIRTKVRLP